MGRYATAGALRRLTAERPRGRRGRPRCARASTDLASRPLHELSGGQRQRAFVAQGLAQEADLLLLDEPITGLDLVSRQHILDAIAAERAAGRAVVVSTHDLGDAAAADHLLLLAGRVVASGPPDDGAHRRPPGRRLRWAPAARRRPHPHPRRPPPPLTTPMSPDLHATATEPAREPTASATRPGAGPSSSSSPRSTSRSRSRSCSSGGAGLAQSSVYRNLAVLERAGVVHRIAHHATSSPATSWPRTSPSTTTT